MAAYKRSNPIKLAKEREAIAQSQAEMEQPQESTLSLVGRALKQGVRQLGQKLQQNRERAQGYGGRPTLNGALVGPGRRKRTVRDTSA
jgi:hypothetical protein